MLNIYFSREIESVLELYGQMLYLENFNIFCNKEILQFLCNPKFRYLVYNTHTAPPPPVHLLPFNLFKTWII
jgi:hypothetical protein